MSRLVVPIRRRILWSTGDVLRWVELVLDLKDNVGGWKQEVFRFDPASEMTTFPAYDAQQLNLPMPQKAALGTWFIGAYSLFQTLFYGCSWNGIQLLPAPLFP